MQTVGIGQGNARTGPVGGHFTTEHFEDFYFKVCCVDYAKMDAACAPLAARMRRTDKVRIKGPGDTDLSFSIKGVGPARIR